MRALLLAGVVVAGWSGMAQASLIGDTVNATYLFPEQDTTYFNLGDQVVSNAVEYDGRVSAQTVDFRADQIILTFTRDSSYSAVPFNGFKFTDLSNAFTSVSFDAASTAAGYSAASVSFSNQAIYLNNSGMTFTNGKTVVLDVTTAATAATAVPEPASLAVLGIGIAGVVAACRRRAA